MANGGFTEAKQHQQLLVLLASMNMTLVSEGRQTLHEPNNILAQENWITYNVSGTPPNAVYGNNGFMNSATTMLLFGGRNGNTFSNQMVQFGK